ncbi:MAG: helix-turn-helix domain-containing protein [Pseudomonadota bacterium]
MKEHIFNIHDVVLIMTVAECVLLAIFQAVLPDKHRGSGILLNLFLLSIAVSTGCLLILWNDAVHTLQFFDETLLPYFLCAALLIKGPTLYLYVCAITQQSFKFQQQHLLHLIPLALCTLWLFIFQLNSYDLSFGTYDNELRIKLVNAVWYFVKIIPLIYITICMNELNTYRTQLKNQYSYFSPTEPGWLNILIIGFFCSWSLTLIVHITAQFVGPQIADSFGIVENYVVFILINALFIYSVVYAHQLLTTKPVIEVIKDKTDEKLPSSAILKVQNGMEIDKLFLKHNLNIDQFSKRIDLPVKDVSAVINKHYNTNFFEFMNKYRVEEAKRLLGDAQYANVTILDILLEAGFNSKSAFHRFFNRLVGVSPTEFRKLALSKKNSPP